MIRRCSYHIKACSQPVTTCVNFDISQNRSSMWKIVRQLSDWFKMRRMRPVCLACIAIRDMEPQQVWPLTWAEVMPLCRLCHKIVLNVGITINYGFNPGSDSRRPSDGYVAATKPPRNGDHRVSGLSPGIAPGLAPSSHGRPTVRPPFWSILLFFLISWLCKSTTVFGSKRHILTKPKQVNANQNVNNVQSAYFDPVLCEW